MVLMESSDLKYQYTWTLIKPDSPKITGHPDSTLLNCNEGFEVLSFINRFALENNFMQKVACHKLERMIKENLPSDIRSHARVRTWVVNNWNKY